MLDTLKRFSSGLGAPERRPKLYAAEERLAAAALLYHVVALDGSVKEGERARLRQVLMKEFGLGHEEGEELIEEARSADAAAVDLYGFTSVLKRKLDEVGRRRVIAMMWDMAFADGEVHEFEDNVLWRVAELLGVSARERIMLKRQARERDG
jgi:uncharacterized tellurite resistance protein B-like protein